MTSATTVKELVFESKNEEDIKSVIELLIDKLNELGNIPNKKYFLGTITNKGRVSEKIYLDDDE